MKRHTLALFTALCLFDYGAEAQTCGVLCDEEFWKSASSEEIAVEISNADVNARTETGHTALMWAASQNAPESVKALVNAGADVDARDSVTGWTALILAGANDAAASAKALADAGADLNARDRTLGMNALMWAASQNAAASVKALVEAGANLNARDESGKTALIMAASMANAASLKVLLDAGAEVNARTESGKTALIYAVEFESFENVKALLDAGADVNAQTEFGKTALIYAVQYGAGKSVKLLLEAGADALISDAFGETAWDYAQDNVYFKGTDAYWMLNDARFGESAQPSATTSLADALGVPDAQAADTPSLQPVGPLTSSELDGFRRDVSKCWNTGALTAGAQHVTVVVTTEMSENGKPIGTSLLRASGGEGAAVTEAYEAARRAILRCGIYGYDLPKEKYAQWRKIEITFNPEQMRTK